MTWHDIYLALRGWQPLIGAVVGFSALIGGALYNYHLNRKRDDSLREKETLAVAVGLYSEITILSTHLSRFANAIGGWYLRCGPSGEDVPEHFSDSFVLAEPTLYKALAPRLGMMPPDILIPVARFYSYYAEAVIYFPNVLAKEDRSVSYGVGWVLGPAIKAIDEVQPALREIERRGVISNPAPVPDLKNARSGKELEDEMRPD